ncbi:hypothetical protein ACJMK2_002767 [Sinanodonta woodiana]|uniref:Uncharacterized protein n=1 Tax=Sinanodonta woodiana TaxID=1069815 RepID=A0ABD3XZI1_SINWO
MSTSTSADKCSMINSVLIINWFHIYPVQYKCRTLMFRDPIALDGTVQYDLNKIHMRRRRHIKRETILHQTFYNP